jgi:hypothetical protein
MTEQHWWVQFNTQSSTNTTPRLSDLCISAADPGGARGACSHRCEGILPSVSGLCSDIETLSDVGKINTLCLGFKIP